jgi:hypothetical protein
MTVVLDTSAKEMVYDGENLALRKSLGSTAGFS